MSENLSIQKAEGIWVVRAGGAVIAETSAALELTEGNAAPVIYFPRHDVAMAFLERTDSRTSCPIKGEASYYSLITKSTTIPDACWSYEQPREAAARIAGYISFYPERVTVEQV